MHLNTVKYFIWYCVNVMDRKQLVEFYFNKNGVVQDKSYMDEKWSQFRKDSNSWFMDLDTQNQERFLDDCNDHYTKED